MAFERVGSEIETFLAPEMGTSVASAIWAQDSGPTPSNTPRYGLLPHPNPYVQPHINNRYIGNFMDKRLETRER